jgi:alkylated DNA repair dioxygenase AlkB
MDPRQPRVLIDNGKSKMWVVENYCPDIFAQLQQLPLYIEPPIEVFNKIGKQNRNVGFFSDESKGYKYSGQFMPSQPLSNAPILQQLLPQVNKSLGTTFNGVLVNSYVNGEKYVGAHKDAEENLDKGGRRMVAGIAFGAVRKFRIRDGQNKNIILDFLHTPCTLIVMEGEFQKDFYHEIPIEKKVKGERISITFRHHTE